MTENESCTGEDLVLVGPSGKEFKAIEIINNKILKYKRKKKIF